MSFNRTEKLLKTFVEPVLAATILHTEAFPQAGTAFADALDKKLHVDALIQESGGWKGIACRNREIKAGCPAPDITIRRGGGGSELAGLLAAGRDSELLKPAYLVYGFWAGEELVDAYIISASKLTFLLESVIIPGISASGSGADYGVKSGVGYSFLYISPAFLESRGAVVGRLAELARN